MKYICTFDVVALKVLIRIRIALGLICYFLCKCTDILVHLQTFKIGTCEYIQGFLKINLFLTGKSIRINSVNRSCFKDFKFLHANCASNFCLKFRISHQYQLSWE